MRVSADRASALSALAAELRLAFRGSPVRICAERDLIAVDADPGVRVSVGGGEGRRFARRDDEWKEAST